MKRIHLFEFEDLSWFPDMWRKSMTRMLVVVHKMLGTEPSLTKLIGDTLKETNQENIVDLCSGGGGPMEDVFNNLQQDHKELKLTMTDLYPNEETVKRINSTENTNLSFIPHSVNAAQVPENLKGLRTMICSFHHMPPEVAKDILQSAKEDQQPICIFELSDNSHPYILAWTAFPINILTSFIITLFTRPLTWYHLLFTYIIPVIPICYAWDGAVSNMRTYTSKDLDLLLSDLEDDTYKWEKGIIKGKGKFSYLVGKPSNPIK